jgi:hypothetical protein
MATKTQTPPVLSAGRQMLKGALEAQGRARALADKAAKVVQYATLAVEQARSEAAKRDEVAEDAVKSRLAILKGERPAKSAEEIRAAQRDRIIAKEELLTSDLTLQAAQQELEEAHGNIARGHRVSATHVIAVLSESAADVVALWGAASLELERLRVLLRAFILVDGHLDAMPLQQQANLIQSAAAQAGLPFGDAVDLKHLQNKIGGALSQNYAPSDPGPGIARARAYWASFADALQADPTAEQPQLPTADTLFI